jgi:hypothetical protein
MIKTIVATTILSAGILAAPIHAEAQAPEPFLRGALADAVNTPCKYEDALNCYWDGGDHSFVSVRVGDKDCIIFTNRAYNRKHGECFDSWSSNR